MLISVDGQFSRWPLDLLRFVEHLHPYRDVHVLSSGGDGSKVAAVPLVEEVPDRLPDAAIHRHHGPRLPVALHRVQLSEGIRLVDRPARRYVPLPVQGVLPAVLPAEEVQEARRCSDDERRRQGRSLSIKGQARERCRERHHQRRRERLFAQEKGCRRLLRERRKPSDGAQPPKTVYDESRVTLERAPSLVDLLSLRRRVFLFLPRNRRRICGPSSLCLSLSLILICCIIQTQRVEGSAEIDASIEREKEYKITSHIFGSRYAAYVDVPHRQYDTSRARWFFS